MPMKFFIWAIALYALLEGVLLTLAPGMLKKFCAYILQLDEEQLRQTGLGMIILAILVGVIVNFL